MIEHTIFIHKSDGYCSAASLLASVVGINAAVVVFVARKSFFFAIRAQTGVMESVVEKESQHRLEISTVSI